MKYSSVCDNCKEKPIPFDVDSGFKGYYMVVARETMDPTILMSSGKLLFRICPIPRHPISEKDMFWCDPCFLYLIDEINLINRES